MDTNMSLLKTAEKVDFLTSKDYPDLCPACKATLDQIASMFMSGDMPDTDDPEAPAMYMYDHGMYCGKTECLHGEEPEEVPECHCPSCERSDALNKSIFETQASILVTARQHPGQGTFEGFPEKVRKPRAPRRRKCIYCDELKPTDNMYYTMSGRPVCEECYSGVEYDSTVVEITPEDVFTHQFNSDFGDPETGELPIPIKVEKWVHTDAWRGYSDWELLPGYVEWSDGWVTGWPDESVSRKKTLAELYDKLRTRKLVPPAPIYWVFGRTSNVFSTSCSIVIAESDRAAIEQWITSIGLTKEDLDHMLG